VLFLSPFLFLSMPALQPGTGNRRGSVCIEVRWLFLHAKPERSSTEGRGTAFSRGTVGEWDLLNELQGWDGGGSGKWGDELRRVVEGEAGEWKGGGSSATRRAVSRVLSPFFFLVQPRSALLPSPSIQPSSLISSPPSSTC